MNADLEVIDEYVPKKKRTNSNVNNKKQLIESLNQK